MGMIERTAKMEADRTFAGSIPALYDRYLGPLIFAAYASDLAARLADLQHGRVLETAAGTGVVTRALAVALPDNVSIDATDLNQPMLDYAAQQFSSSRVKWQQADASALPFGDAVFDAIVCQFGVMFFPDKGKAFAEARRVLKPRGRFLFNVWDRIEENEFADTVMVALATVFPHDPPMFMERTPHGYHDIAEIQEELRRAGFANTMVDTVAKESTAPSPREPAIGFCQGTPMRNEIEASDPTRLAEATDVAENSSQTWRRP
jgi:ubiquinone/menaquinone biosynthesis C-methylase UbiE